MEVDKSLLFTSLVFAKLFSADAIKDALKFGAQHAGYSDAAAIESVISQALTAVGASNASGSGEQAAEAGGKKRKEPKEKKERKPRPANGYTMFLNLFFNELTSKFAAHPEMKPVKVDGEKGDSPLILASKAWSLVTKEDKDKFVEIFAPMCDEANAKSKADGSKTELPKELSLMKLGSTELAWVKGFMGRMFKQTMSVLATHGEASGDVAVATGGEDGDEDEKAEEAKPPASTGKKAKAATPADAAAATSAKKRKEATPAVAAGPESRSKKHKKDAEAAATAAPVDKKEKKKKRKHEA